MESKNFVLQVINGTQKGQIFDLESDKITIGRRLAPKEKKRDWILIEDFSLARIHALLEWDAEKGLYKIILKASNKNLILNDESVEEGYLYHSDKIQLGDIIFRIWDGKPDKSAIIEETKISPKFEPSYEYSNNREVNAPDNNVQDIKPFKEKTKDLQEKKIISENVKEKTRTFGTPSNETPKIKSFSFFNKNVENTQDESPVKKERKQRVFGNVNNEEKKEESEFKPISLTSNSNRENNSFIRQSASIETKSNSEFNPVNLASTFSSKNKNSFNELPKEPDRKFNSFEEKTFPKREEQFSKIRTREDRIEAIAERKFKEEQEQEQNFDQVEQPIVIPKEIDKIDVPEELKEDSQPQFSKLPQRFLGENRFVSSFISGDSSENGIVRARDNDRRQRKTAQEINVDNDNIDIQSLPIKKTPSFDDESEPFEAIVNNKSFTSNKSNNDFLNNSFLNDEKNKKTEEPLPNIKTGSFFEENNARNSIMSNYQKFVGSSNVSYSDLAVQQRRLANFNSKHRPSSKVPEKLQLKLPVKKEENEQNSITEKPILEKQMVEPMVEKTIVEKPMIEKPMIEKTMVERSMVEKPMIERPMVEKPMVERPIVEKPMVEKTMFERPMVEKPIVEKPMVERPMVEKPMIGKPMVEKPMIGKPTLERSTLGKTTFGKSTIEKPTLGKPTIEKPILEKPILEKKDQVGVANNFKQNNRNILLSKPLLNTETGINPVSEDIPNSESLPFVKQEEKSLNLSIFGNGINPNSISNDSTFSATFSNQKAEKQDEEFSKSPFFINDLNDKNEQSNIQKNVPLSNEDNDSKKLNDIDKHNYNLFGNERDLPIVEQIVQTTSDSDPFSLARRRDERLSSERPSGLLEPSDFSESSSKLSGIKNNDIYSYGFPKNNTERPSGLLEPSDFSESSSKISANVDVVNSMPVQIPSLGSTVIDIRDNMSPLVISGENQAVGLMIDPLAMNGNNKSFPGLMIDPLAVNGNNKSFSNDKAPAFDPFSTIVDLAERKNLDSSKQLNNSSLDLIENKNLNFTPEIEIKENKVSSFPFEEVKIGQSINAEETEEEFFPEIGQNRMSDFAVKLPELPVSENRRKSNPIFSFDLSEKQGNSSKMADFNNPNLSYFDNSNQNKKEVGVPPINKPSIPESPMLETKSDNKHKKFSKMRFSGVDVVQKPVLSSAGFTNAVDSDIKTSDADMEKFLEKIEQNREENQNSQRVNTENKSDKASKSNFFGPASSIDLSFADYKMQKEEAKLEEKNKKVEPKQKEKKEEVVKEEPKKVKKLVTSVSLPPLKDLISNDNKDNKEEDKKKDKKKSSKSSSFAFEDLFVEQTPEPSKEEKPKKSYFDNDDYYQTSSSSKKSSEVEDEISSEKSVLSMFLENKEKKALESSYEAENNNTFDWYIKFVKMPGMGMNDTFDMEREEMIIGRGSSSDLSLKDMALADRHVKLYMQNGELYLQKLDRKKQIYINGNPLISSASRVLKIGDRIQLSDMTVFEIQKR